MIVNNQSLEAETLAWFDAISVDLRVKVIRFDAPYKFSAFNNAAARQAQGEVLCLLNNDTQVIMQLATEPDQRQRMLSAAQQCCARAMGN